jgi:uncharacterized protein YjbJ (UPF0337 family)
MVKNLKIRGYGTRQKAEGRRQKAEGKRQKAKGKREREREREKIYSCSSFFPFC